MTPEELAGRFVRIHRANRWIVCCLDFDGTLVPIVPRPDEARPGDRARRILAALSTVPRVRLAIISGRALDDLRERVDVPGLAYAGSGGLQVEIDGRRRDHPELARFDALAARCRDLLDDIVRRWPGAWLQVKPGQLTLHFREVADPERPALERAVRDATARAGLPVRLLDGPRAIEFAPTDGWDKGDAVDRVCAGLPRDDVVPLCAGDHANDADAFRAAHRRGGSAIGVGPAAPRGADLRLGGPAALLDWLGMLTRRLGITPAGEAPNPDGG